MIIKWVLVALCFVGCIPAGANAESSSSEPFKVTFLNPDVPGDAFWDLFTSFMQAAADDLHIDLTVEYTHKIDRFEMLKRAKHVIESEQKPDYFVSIFKRNVSQKLLELVESHQVPFFSVNSDIHDKVRKVVGGPRETYKQWIGQITPNDENAGYLLAKTLIKQANLLKRQANRPADEKLGVLAMTGSRDSSAAYDRNKGLERALSEHPEALLHQLSFTAWSPDNAYNLVSRLLHRFPSTDIVWSASDAIALSSVKAIATEKVTERSIVNGGIDWSLPGIEGVKQGTLTTSVGGHFVEGAIALVLLRDYHQGKDFSEELGVKISTDFTALTAASDFSIVDRIESNQWNKVDFKRLSKTYNSSLEQYDFSYQNIFLK